MGTAGAAKPAGYVMSALVSHALDLGAWSGLQTARILEAAGVTREELHPRSGRMPVETAARLLKAGLAIAGDPALPLKLSRVTFTNGFGVVGYLLQSCTTLQDALDSLMRYEKLISDLGYTRLVHEPGQVLWAHEVLYDDPDMVRISVEYLAGVRYRFLLMVDARRSDIVREVRFRHAEPSDPAHRAAYDEVFGCPLRFGAPENAIVLTARALSTPLRQHDAMLREAVSQQAEKKLGELAGELPFPEQVRRELRVLLVSGQASRETLAERLGVSGRHLGRLLAHAGLGYRELVDELRMEIAREYLLKSTRTVGQVGEALGFGDAQSFIRWFRTAAGVTPGDFRQRQAPVASGQAPVADSP